MTVEDPDALIPEDLRSLERAHSGRLVIQLVEDIGPLTKLVPTLEVLVPPPLPQDL
jgi:hypothetical protein